MSKAALVLIALAAMFQMMVSGCGDSVVTVNVDVLSFLDSTAVKQTYGDDPVIPPGPIPVVIDSEPQRVNLSEGLADVTDIQSVSLRLSSEFVNETGTADVQFSVFISDTLTNPYSTEPYVEENLHLEPAYTDTIHVDILGDEALGELLTGQAVDIGLRLRFDSSRSSENVRGTETLVRFIATVVARRHIP